MTRYWINTVSWDHVQIGRKNGIVQANHGKIAPLKRLSAGDRILFYSPRTTLKNGDPLQMFTAAATLTDEEIYQVVLSRDFTPYRRNAHFEECQAVDIKPLIEKLRFIQDKKSWGYMFRFGLFEIPKDDFHLIYSKMKNTVRCIWAGENPLMIQYHDVDWGVPVHDDRKHFEMLILEGAQAGLSWETVLRKRWEYRKAFKGFDPKKVARMTDAQLEGMLENPGIIRNRLKVFSARKNARVFVEIQNEFGSFDAYVWRFVGGKPVDGRRKTLKSIPANTAQSDVLSVDLKKRGMSFVGSTIIYAYMQATGLVNDHTTDCWFYR